VNFNPTDQGGLDTRALTLALYSTMYAKQGFYVDVIANYLKSAHDSQRRVEILPADDREAQTCGT